jgi:hydrogenase-4 membrane subunit HyfE
MTLPLILFLMAVVIPVFFGKLRSAPFWLTMQALALGWHGAVQREGLDRLDGHLLAALLEVLIVRAALAPWLLRRAIRRDAGPNLDLMPSNLFAWAAGIALIVLAFGFGAPAVPDQQAVTLGVVAATVAVAMLLLSTNDAPPAQLVALMFMENALALFESLQPEPWPLPVHGTLSAVYLLTVAVGSWLVGTPDAQPTAAETPPADTPLAEDRA